MKKPLFTGACTALVTPFEDGQVNYTMLEKLLTYQIDNGIHAIVICGTTGEAPTLTDSEKIKLFRHAKSFVGDDCLIIAGTGSNNTKHAVELSQRAQGADVDAVLIVSPYYNKANPDGLEKHYRSISEAVEIPIIVYNVPSRTGLDIPVSVYRQLCRIPNIVGIKEASSAITKITQIRLHCGDNLTIWSGNDDQIVPAMALGANGVISVLSNVFPAETQAMAMAAHRGDFKTAAALQIQYQPIVEALFSDVSPIPVKAAMNLLGFDCGGCRLPLGQMDENKLEQLKNVLLR